VAELLPLLREAFAQGSAVRLTVKGGSMWPFVKAGDVVTLEPASGPPFRLGDPLLVRQEDGVCLLHRVVRREADRVYLAGDHSQQREGPFTPTQVLARAVSVSRGARTWRLDRGWWRLLALVWIALMPVRPLVWRAIKGLRRLPGSRPRTSEVTRELTAAVLHLCARFGREEVWTPGEWGYAALWAQHRETLGDLGLTGPLAAGLVRSGGCSFAALPAGLGREYLLQTARGAQTADDLQAIAGALRGAGVEAVVLKGGAALTWLYDDSVCRRVSDLDLLVTGANAPGARRALAGLGYRYVGPPPCSPEVEWLLAQRAACRSLLLRHDQRTTVDLHAASPALARHSPLLAEILARPGPALGPGGLRRPSPELFLLHAALHFLNHWSEGRPQLLGLCDILVLLRRHGAELDWHDLWARAREWNCAAELGTVLATVASLGGMDVPGLPLGATAIPPEALLYGPARGRRLARARQAELAVADLRLVAKLPTWGARLRCLRDVAFPSPEYIRYQDRLPEGQPVNLRRVLFLPRKLLRLGLGLLLRRRASQAVADR
jgi:hypothetical protein